MLLQHHYIPFETTRVSLFSDTMERELSAYFPGEKVSVLDHGELVVWDSL
ncbi:MAG: hypothetical protein KDI49_06145 [Gammaproteobacteria bacterium]|nr:hypothetical protein [Gammaproteobacteria bacterium]MCB1871576.1 hypothetical protein [Gammaproteobacteria bacterium]